MRRTLDIVVLGLSITSSWGNGHATTYRSLLRAMAKRGHSITFLERDVPWYAKHRDLPNPPFCRTHLYASLQDLAARFGSTIADADAVVVGSYVPEGIALGEMVSEFATGICAFYDIDTPVTLENLVRGKCEYLSADLIPAYDLYLSFTGGPTLHHLEESLGSPMARALYCCVDVERYAPAEAEIRWDMGYLGTYSRDRQPPLEELLLKPARLWPDGRFVVAGPQYPVDIDWPSNVDRVEHLPPAEHPAFYHSQRFTLNLTRADMRVAGYSPSVRLFEAAACGTPIISDMWRGLDELFELGSEILTVSSAEQVLRVLQGISPQQRGTIAAAARKKIMAEHTAEHRAAQLEAHLAAAVSGVMARPSDVASEAVDG